MANDTLPQAASSLQATSDCDNAPSPKLVNAYALLQEKWTLFIVHALMRGPIGFNEMGRRAGPVNTTTLAQRLSNLEHAGLIRKTVHSNMPPRTSYELTEAGLALRPVLEAIASWSERYVPDQAMDCPGE